MRFIEYNDDAYILIEEGKLEYLTNNNNIFLHLIPSIYFYYYPGLYYIKNGKFYFINMDLLDFEKIPEHWVEYQKYLKEKRNMISYQDFLNL